MTQSRRPALLATLATLLALAACQEPPADLSVEICGDLEIPSDLEALRVSILSADRAPLRAGTVELLRCPEGLRSPLPQRVTLPLPDPEVWVQVQGLRGGVEILRAERRLRGASGGDLVRLGLTRDCLGASCALGQTCVQGACLDILFLEGFAPCASLSAPAPEPSDAGLEDSGRDASTEATEATDADMADAEADAPPSLCPVDLASSPVEVP